MTFPATGKENVLGLNPHPWSFLPTQDRSRENVKHAHERLGVDATVHGGPPRGLRDDRHKEVTNIRFRSCNNAQSSNSFPMCAAENQIFEMRTPMSLA
jgi:hypothetical protein